MKIKSVGLGIVLYLMLVAFLIFAREMGASKFIYVDF